MSGSDRESEWSESQSRARQPIGPDGFSRRSGLGRATRPGSGRRQVQARGDLAPGGRPRVRTGADPVRSPDGRGGGGRTRFVAVLVLVVAAVIVIVGGIAATTGDGGSGAGVSISILPFPQDTDTTVTQ